MHNFNAIPIYYKKLDENVIIPSYANEHDAGMDIHANQSVLINPQETLLIRTGLSIELPIGYELQIRPRSGLSANTPIRIANSPATIDSGFRGEIKIIITNTSADDEKYTSYEKYDLKTKGNKQGIYRINKYDRIAQIVLNKFENIRFIEKEELNKSDRGEKGFGSSGIN
jgi:dUTP pyrophosphatase